MKYNRINTKNKILSILVKLAVFPMASWRCPDLLKLVPDQITHLVLMMNHTGWFETRRHKFMLCDFHQKLLHKIYGSQKPNS